MLEVKGWKGHSSSVSNANTIPSDMSFQVGATEAMGDHHGAGSNYPISRTSYVINIQKMTKMRFEKINIRELVITAIITA